MILSDQSIQDYNIILGDTGKLNPASYDFTTNKPVEIIMLPGESLLLSTNERVNMPEHVAGLLVLRTSAFRKGLALASPGWIDPGYTGTLTFRVTNVSDQPIEIGIRERLIQVIFMELDDTPEQIYNGKYQGSTGTVGYIPDPDGD